MLHWAQPRLLAAVISALASCAPALAQGMPSPSVQEVLVKSILVTLSDAVAADNFAVLHAKISKPFRDQFPPDKLQAVFKDLVDKHAVFDAIVAWTAGLTSAASPQKERHPLDVIGAHPFGPRAK